MKKLLFIVPLIILQTGILNAYSITNSKESTVPLAIAITLSPKAYPNRIHNKASYELQPGQSGAWNQNEIRQKLNTEFLTVWIVESGHHRWDDSPIIFKIDQMPIGAALEIVVAKIGTAYVGGAIDKTTGTIYNEKDYNHALQYLRGTLSGK